ncbi:hypothetical protein HYU19_04515 [Candidatus Woesearchaeota archaeon]|nr:hypothetical protein [Candidatus Woesearchaeota archaeon]
MNNIHSGYQQQTHLHAILGVAKIVAMLLLLAVLLAFTLLVKNTFNSTFPAAKQTVNPDAPAEAVPVALPAISGNVVHLNIDRVMKVWKRDRNERLLKGPRLSTR